MKPIFAILTALASMVYASPVPDADDIKIPVQKRQGNGCTPCRPNGTLTCWSCTSGGCTYLDHDC